MKYFFLLFSFFTVNCVFASQSSESPKNTPAVEQSILDIKLNRSEIISTNDDTLTEDEAVVLTQQELIENQKRLTTLIDFCTPCHGNNGVSSLPIYPNIAGQSAVYLEKQLWDFKTQKRTEKIMATIVQRLDENDIEMLAEYFGQLDHTGQKIKMKEPEIINPINVLAEQYVRLALAVGQHQDYYIDAYYGPEEWQPKNNKKPLLELLNEANDLIDKLLIQQSSEAEQLRLDMLIVQSRSVKAFIEILQGKEMTFDEESTALYDAVSPDLGEADFEQALDELDDILPGWWGLNGRLVDFNEDFVIPLDKLDSVFKAAINESRARTKQHIDLPEEESFVIEYVTNQPWSAYNWYKGNSFSVIQMNTDHPIHIDRAIDLASHEGYPGHHVFNSLMEKHLVNGNGWVEYSIYPLYSPLSLLAEGSANYGIEVAYTQKEREQFEREVLFPLAGLDPSKVSTYYRVQSLLSKLSYAGNVAAKYYLDGKFDEKQAREFLMKYALSSKEKSQQRLNFFERYRAYVINYNLGQDIVREYVEQQSGSDILQRWQVFSELLANPRSASMMKVQKK